MNTDNTDILIEHNEDMLFADGFDDALIGVAYRADLPPIAAYDFSKCVEILVSTDGMTEDEAVEYLSFNAVGSYVGECTPVFIMPLKSD